VTQKNESVSRLLAAPSHAFVDDRELAARLKISPKTPAQWRFTGKFAKELPYYKFGRAVRYASADVEAFIDKMRVGGIDIVEGE
jgi:hypothetical protein